MNFFPSFTFPSESSRTYSGSFSTSFEYDTETRKIVGFKFNGGEIFTTAYGLLIQDFITYPSPTNTQSTTVTKAPYQNVAFGVIQLSPETRENNEGEVEFGSVDSEGTLTNIDHKYLATQGIYYTSFVIRGVPQDTVIDNYTQGVNLFYRGESTVELREVSNTIHDVSVRAYLTIELDESDISTLQGTSSANDIQIIETEEGSVFAQTGQFKIPTAYGEWADENDLFKPDPEDTNDSGFAYGILFALDLPADATALPISIDNTPGGPIATIILPESGLNSPMGVEYTTDLSIGDWPALPDMYYLDGTDSLDLGATGTPTFGFPAGDLGFIRFTTVLE
ncbi:hypothetical protein [Haloferula sp.]|uniref:hypothetical protein n=1 Tax=Haloferula sp. TaxID=2497595 RepID=UPI00329E8C1B